MRLSYLWDYDLSESDFADILQGHKKLGHLDEAWALCRLLEYAPYTDILRLLGFKKLVESWPMWKNAIRSRSRERGLTFLVQWLPKHHPELL